MQPKQLYIIYQLLKSLKFMHSGQGADMGNSESLTREEIHFIANFSQKDVARLYHRFRKLDEDGDGQLDPSEILGASTHN
ncbi:Calcineurin subunit B [Symbiodinium microadriaticum]|uniref:Calcineurin subunit B n=1 Tax=Symbiodinium microadriaticum TaxID=2951 RepID=A0A1Q9CYA1_SYMMI|nr:Calcineurin subunit B [Symbiodinium microadriaticum]